MLIAVVFVYLNLKESKHSSKAVSGPDVQNLRTDSGKTGEVIPPEIPEIYDLSKLTIDSKLKPAKLNLPDSIKVPDSEIKISVKIPSAIGVCDLFLFVDNEKRDMFYRVKGGTYEFKNVKLIHGKNHIEVFYRIGKKRSASSSSVIVRE